MRPGDMVVFHGMVGGERGMCLVISVEPVADKPLGFYANVLSNCSVVRVYHDRLYEDISWSRINAREEAP